MEFDHLTLRVVVDGVPYLVDVGFGDGFHEPMKLIPGCSSDFHQRQFRIEERGDRFRLESCRDGELDKG